MIKSQKLFSFHWQEESTQGQHGGRYGRRDEDKKKMSTSLVILSIARSRFKPEETHHAVIVQ